MDGGEAQLLNVERFALPVNTVTALDDLELQALKRSYETVHPLLQIKSIALQLRGRAIS